MLRRVSDQPRRRPVGHTHARLLALQRGKLLGIGRGGVSEQEQVRDAGVVDELETAFLDDGDDALDRSHRDLPAHA